MKPKTVAILWIVTLVLGVIACIVRFGGSDETQSQTKLSPGDKLLTNLPVLEISTITLKQGENTTNLNKLSDDTWGVEERADYPISYEKLRNLLGALRDLEVTQSYAVTKKHFPRFSLADSSENDSEIGIHVTMKKTDGTTVADFHLGKFTGSRRSMGRFIRLTNDDTGVYSVEETFPEIGASPQGWLNPEFLNITGIKSIAVTAPDDPAFKGWKLVRHPNTDGTENRNGQFKLASMEQDEVMQIGSTNPLRNLFVNSGFRDVLSAEQARESSNPDAMLKRIASITTYDGLLYTITFWPQKEKHKDPNADPRLPAVQTDYILTINISLNSQAGKINEAEQKQAQAKINTMSHLKGRIYRVPQSVIAPLQIKRSDFVKSTSSPSGTPAPARLPGLPQPVPSRR